MTTDTLSPRTAQQVEQNAQEIDHYVVQIREAVDKAKTRLDGGDEDPVEIDRIMDLRINHLQNFIKDAVAGQTNVVAQALAEHYGVRYLKKHSAADIAPKIANHLVGALKSGSEDYSTVSRAATAMRMRVDRIDEAGRTLRYWASDAFEADDSEAWRMSGDVDSVQAMLKFWGKVYCQARGLDGIMVYENDDHLGHDTVEEALERIGRYALHRTMAGIGRFGASESSMLQIRLGNLLGCLYEDFAHKAVIKMTLGALTTGTTEIKIGFDYDDANEYQPSWSGPVRARKAFDALQP